MDTSNRGTQFPSFSREHNVIVYTIRRISRGLAEVIIEERQPDDEEGQESSRIQLIHETVREFLTTEGLRILRSSMPVYRFLPSDKPAIPEDAFAHLHITLDCLQFLGAETSDGSYFQSYPTPVSTEWHEHFVNSARYTSIAEYAAKVLFLHARCAEAGGISQSYLCDLQRWILDTTYTVLNLVIKSIRYAISTSANQILRSLSNTEHLDKDYSIYHFQHRKGLGYFNSSYDLEISLNYACNERHYSLFHISCIFGLHTVVASLLDRIDSMPIEIETGALSIAAAASHPRVVASISSFVRQLRNSRLRPLTSHALSEAICQGNMGMFNVLVDKSGCSAKELLNVADFEFAETIEDIEDERYLSSGGAVLHKAMRNMIRHGPPFSAIKLSWYPSLWSGVLRKCDREGVNFYLRTSHGETLITYGACFNSSNFCDTLSLLVQAGMRLKPEYCTNSRTGETFLMRLMSPEYSALITRANLEETFKILDHEGCSIINAIDCSGGNALSALLHRPYRNRTLNDEDTIGLLKTLVVQGPAEFQTQPFGRSLLVCTALFYDFKQAIATGKRCRSEILLTLLDENRDLGIDFDVKDKNGRTALSYAAQGGHIRELKLLLATKKYTETSSVINGDRPNNQIDINSKDEEGRTPLSYAAEHKHLEVIRELLLDDEIDARCTDTLGRDSLWFATLDNIRDCVLASILRIKNLDAYKEGDLQIKEEEITRDILSMQKEVIHILEEIVKDN